MLFSSRILVTVAALIGISGIESNQSRKPKNRRIFKVDGKLLTANYENSPPTSTVVRHTRDRKSYSKVNQTEKPDSASCIQPASSKSTDEGFKKLKEYRKPKKAEIDGATKLSESRAIVESLQSFQILVSQQPSEDDYTTVIEPTAVGVDGEEVIARLRRRYGVFHAKNLERRYNPADDKILNLEEQDQELVCRKVIEHVRLIERIPESRFLAYMDTDYRQGCPAEVREAYGAEKLDKVPITWYPSIAFQYVDLPVYLGGIGCKITELNVTDGEPIIDVQTVFAPNWLLITRGESDYSVYVFRAYPTENAERPSVIPYAHLTFHRTLKPMVDKVNDPVDYLTTSRKIISLQKSGKWRNSRVRLDIVLGTGKYRYLKPKVTELLLGIHSPEEYLYFIPI